MCVCTKKMIFSVELINISTTFHDSHFLFFMCAHTRMIHTDPPAQLNYTVNCVCTHTCKHACVYWISGPQNSFCITGALYPSRTSLNLLQPLNTALLFQWVRHCKFHLGIMAAGFVFLFHVLSEWGNVILSVTDWLCTTPCLSIHLSTKPPVVSITWLLWKVLYWAGIRHINQKWISFL